MISVTVTFGNITAAASQNYAKVIVFSAEAGKNDYTVEDVPQLVRIIGKAIGEEIFKADDEGSNLINGNSVLATWDDETFSISDSITVSENDKIIIWYY